MSPRTRPVSWVKAALKEFETFPEGARSICLGALTIAAEGGKADIVKPMRGMGSGVFEAWHKTPKHELDLVKDRLKRLREMVR